ncbi:hypothetical protein T12_15268 [Trichinella patagoniensis]|uniref:Uncharacterized protein n=1 Tax=Trichinella patagoniensis TaxID=990121 RepID=A0A0V1A6Z3_9BILA|nr:hypothetical protein T12_15268 [Trichinella patagoniensis]
MHLSMLLSTTLLFALYPLFINAVKIIPRYPETESIIHETLFLINIMNSTKIPARVFFHLTDVTKNLENGGTITVQFLATNSNCTQLEWMKHDPKDCPPVTTQSTSKFIVVTATGKPSTNGKLTVNGNYRPANDDDLLETD